MKRILFLMVILFSTCKSSYELHPDVILHRLHREARMGNIVSAYAYEMYMDLLLKIYPRHLDKPIVVDKLVDIGLCTIVDSALIIKQYPYADDGLKTFYISDKLDKLSPK